MIADDRVWNTNKETEERLAGMQVPNGKEGTPMNVLHSGDIGVVAKLGETSTGDTFCKKDASSPPKLTILTHFTSCCLPKTQSDAAKLSNPHPSVRRRYDLSWYNEPAARQAIIQGMVTSILCCHPPCKKQIQPAWMLMNQRCPRRTDHPGKLSLVPSQEANGGAGCSKFT